LTLAVRALDINIAKLVLPVYTKNGNIVELIAIRVSLGVGLRPCSLFAVLVLITQPLTVVP
jgi:hypothetical protein